MTQHFVESSGTQQQLIVFQQNFTNKECENLDTILNNFEDDFEAKQSQNWAKYWEEQGEHTILEQWKLKYQSYLDKSLEATEVNIEIAADIKDSEFIAADKQKVLEQVEAQHNTEGWQKLWQDHIEEVYAEQYILYSSIYYNYYLDLKKSLQAQESELSQSIAEEQVFSESKDLVADLEQLQLLGLPTAFGYRKQYNKKIRNKDLAQHLSVFFSDNEEDDCIEQHENYIALLEMDANSEITVDADLALHALHNKSITKSKKKNRKLRQVPAFLLEDKGLLKYWRKRFSLFSRFDAGIRLDRESWFSVTPEKVAVHLAERLRCDVLVDGFCGCGGNTIQFAKTCRQIIAIDIDPVKLEMAKHNARIYGVAEKIEFILGDFLQLSRCGKLQGDVVFLSPPWGGPKYKKKQDYDIEEFLLPVGATDLMACGRNISNNVVFFLPRNCNLQQIIKLAGVGNRCEVEHNYLDTRLIALTALYGEDILSKET